MRAPMLVLIAVGVLGCSPPEGSDESHGFEVRDSSGVELAHNFGTASRPLAVTERLVIGTVEGATPGDRVHQVLTLDGTASGRVVAATEFAFISVYEADGQLAHRLGGRGQGPSEFEFLIAAYGDGDKFVGVDGQVSKVVVFDSAGAFSSSASAAPPGAIGIWALGIFDGDLFVRPSETTRSAPDGESVARLFPIHRLELASGELSDSIGGVPNGSVIGATRGPVVNLLDTIGYGRLLSDSSYLVGAGSQYRVEERSFDGALLRRVTRDYDPVPVDRARHREVVEEYVENAGGPIDVDDRMARLPEQDHVPPVYMVFPTDDGSFWVWRRDEFEDPMLELAGGSGGEYTPEPPLFDLFNPRGRYVGSWRPPRGEEIRGWGSDWIASVRRDDLGVEYIVVYDVRPSEGV